MKKVFVKTKNVKQLISMSFRKNKECKTTNLDDEPPA